MFVRSNETHTSSLQLSAFARRIAPFRLAEILVAIIGAAAPDAINHSDALADCACHLANPLAHQAHPDRVLSCPVASSAALSACFAKRTFDNRTLPTGTGHRHKWAQNGIPNTTENTLILFAFCSHVDRRPHRTRSRMHTMRTNGRSKLEAQRAHKPRRTLHRARCTREWGSHRREQQVLQGGDTARRDTLSRHRVSLQSYNTEGQLCLDYACGVRV
jgi:hypothetical protein